MVPRQHSLAPDGPARHAPPRHGPRVRRRIVRGHAGPARHIPRGPFAGLALARTGAAIARGELTTLATPAAAAGLAAVIAWLAVVEREPFQLVAWTNLGNIMLRHERWDEAEGYLARAAKIDESNADLQFHLGALRFHQRRYAESERHLRQMLERHGSDYRGHRLLAQVLRQQGRADEAKQHLLESVRLDPDRKRRGRPGTPAPETVRELE